MTDATSLSVSSDLVTVSASYIIIDLPNLSKIPVQTEKY